MIEIKEGTDGKKYKVSNGTWYNIETEDKIVSILENIRISGKRVRFHWGNAKTGEDWGDVYDVAGTIGRSTGEIKIPLLINNKRSMGGGGILTHCIVKITTTSNVKKVIYQHPKYYMK